MSVELMVAVLVAIASLVQWREALYDLSIASRPAIEQRFVEKDLVDEIRGQIRRLRARRSLRQMRSPGEHRAIRHVEPVLLSWSLLLAASATAIWNQLT